MPADVRVYDASLIEVSSPLAIAVTPGTRTTAVELFVINDMGEAGADTAYGRVIRVLERPQGGTTWYGSGLELVDGRHVEIRILEGYGDLTAPATAWTPVGADRDYPLPALPSGDGVRLELSVLAPPDLQGGVRELLIRTGGSARQALGRGHTETDGDGVYLGLRDGLVDYLLESSTIVENPGGADEFVSVPDVGGILAGEPVVELSQLYEWDDLDGDAVALGAGKAYWGLLYLGASGLADVRSPQGTDPLDASEQPTAPAGILPLAMVYRDDSAIVTDAEITQLWERGACLPRAVSGTAVAFGPSPHGGLVDNGWWRRDVEEQAVLSTSVTSHVWRLPDHTLSVTEDGSRPDPRALLLAEVDTDGSGVTAIRRRLRWLGSPRVMDFVFDESLTGSLVRYATLTDEHPLYLAPMRGLVQAQLWDAGSGTSGETRWDIEYREPGGSWTSLFGGDATRPHLDFDATDLLDASSLPSTCVIPARSVLRCSLAAEVAGGTVPAGGVVSLLGWR